MTFEINYNHPHSGHYIITFIISNSNIVIIIIIIIIIIIVLISYLSFFIYLSIYLSIYAWSIFSSSTSNTKVAPGLIAGADPVSP